MVGGVPWTLLDDLAKRVGSDGEGHEWLPLDQAVMNALERERARRAERRSLAEKLCASSATLRSHPVILKWLAELEPLKGIDTSSVHRLPVNRVAADPYSANERVQFRKSDPDMAQLCEGFVWDAEDMYGYGRGYACSPSPTESGRVVLDPTAGGGSIPFEALRLGHSVIANDLNPVASVILKATLDYPLRYGTQLVDDISHWGQRLLTRVDESLSRVFLVPTVGGELANDYIYVREVTCPHCGGEAPLLNTCWLSKASDRWATRVVVDGKPRNGKVRFDTYRVVDGKGPNGEDPDFATVRLGKGMCIHCGQAISSDEIKKQARGESPHGRWRDRLYCVVAVREQPKLDPKGRPIYFKTGARAGEVRTEKTVFYRPPTDEDLKALEESERMLRERWNEWDRQGLIPTERIPDGQKTKEPLSICMTRWCDMFTPRQLLGHLTLTEELNRLKPEIISVLGRERGRAVVTYLQFAIDKGLDYNSRQTRWHYSRGVIANTFARHDFSIKWTFAEMVFSGPHSGSAWGLSQVVDAYRGIAELLEPVLQRLEGGEPPVRVLCGTAANLDVVSESVDLVCIDPPYYDNVQYGELSDYFYVWQRRTLGDLYPDWFRRRLTDKTDEAVANPVRDGSRKAATLKYQRLMSEIFAECRRVLKPDGIMTVMFTHKSTDAWEALTRSLIETGWTITSSAPVESEAAESMHQKDMAAAASSIFLSCRKREERDAAPSIWAGIDGGGVLEQVKEAVRQGLRELDNLRLNPVDEMVASYGRALKALSEAWPVIDGDDLVSPAKAMEEASLVVNQHQISRITGGRIRTVDLDAETAMALTAYGVFGLAGLDYDQALNMSRSLSTALVQTDKNYDPNCLKAVGVASEKKSKALGTGNGEESGYHAPFVRSGSNLRLARPEERSTNRLSKPLTVWDVLQGLIVSYREGDVPVARAYLDAHAQGTGGLVLDMLRVWMAKAADEKIRKEAQALLFGLEQMGG